MSISAEIRDFKEVSGAITEARAKKERNEEFERYHREMEARNRPVDPSQLPEYQNGVQQYNQRYPKGIVATYAPPSAPVSSPDVGRVASAEWR
jgi:hypothetical protein